MTDRVQLHQDDIDGILMWSLIRAARRAGQIVSDALRPHGLNPVQFGVLAQLAAAGMMTQAQLARAVLVRPQSMAPLLTEMEELGLITRSQMRERGRSNPVALTDAGAQRLREAWPSASNTNDLSRVGIDVDSSRAVNKRLLQVIHDT